MEIKDELFRLNIPTRVFYGRNIMEEVLQSIKKDFLSSNILIVTTGRSLERFGYLKQLSCCLKDISDGTITIFDGISANPSLDEVIKGVNIAKRVAAQTIIGFGGGSAIDAAKAIAVGAAIKESIVDTYRNGVSPKEALPIIAIPTTAGTGSELSKAAILTDVDRKKKGGLRGEKLYPIVAIVDSIFTESVPFGITMETGFDVLAHAMESYISIASSPFTELLSEYVLKEAGSAIRKLIVCLDDVESRSKMSFCSMLMGINLGNASTALPHRLQYPIGAYTNSSHGIGLAAIYPAWMEYEKKYSPEKIKKILKLLNITDISELLSNMKINVHLSNLGITNEMIEQLAGDVSGNIQNDPAAREQNIIRKIYFESI